MAARPQALWLTVNCRNTHHIHTAAYRFYGGETIGPPEIAGTRLCRSRLSERWTKLTPSSKNSGG